MSDFEEEDILFLQLGVLSKMKKKKKRKRKKWARELLRKREEKGANNNLIQEIKLASRESFFKVRFNSSTEYSIYLRYIHSSSSKHFFFKF